MGWETGVNSACILHELMPSRGGIVIVTQGKRRSFCDHHIILRWNGCTARAACDADYSHSRSCSLGTLILVNELTELFDYVDDRGNVIESPAVFDQNIAVTIRGMNNRIIVDPGARIRKLHLVFDCDNGTLIIGPSEKHGFAFDIRIGQDATVGIGADVTSTSTCIISALEGATVRVGDDVMLASENELRADDGPRYSTSSPGSG